MIFLYPLIKEANEICYEKKIGLEFSPFVLNEEKEEIFIRVDNDKGQYNLLVIEYFQDKLEKI